MLLSTHSLDPSLPCRFQASSSERPLGAGSMGPLALFPTSSLGGRHTVRKSPPPFGLNQACCCFAFVTGWQRRVGEEGERNDGRNIWRCEEGMQVWLYLGVAEGITRCKVMQSCFMLFCRNPMCSRELEAFRQRGRSGWGNIDCQCGC